MEEKHNAGGDYNVSAISFRGSAYTHVYVLTFFTRSHYAAPNEPDSLSLELGPKSVFIRPNESFASAMVCNKAPSYATLYVHMHMPIMSCIQQRLHHVMSPNHPTRPLFASLPFYPGYYSSCLLARGPGSLLGCRSSSVCWGLAPRRT